MRSDVRVARAPLVERVRSRRTGLLVVLGSVALALVPWTAYLGATLPARHVTHHWDVVWTGFDVFEVAAIVATVLAVLRSSPLLPVVAAVAGTALLSDAWFDVITAEPGRELSWALAGLAGELPLAAVCLWLAIDSLRAGATAAETQASAADPPPTGRPG
jgi:hypothetical protein